MSKLTTPQDFLQRFAKTPDDYFSNAIREEIEKMLTSGRLTLDMRGKIIFSDVNQVDRVLTEYQDLGWDCTMYLERGPDVRREIVFQPPQSTDKAQAK